MDTRLSMGDARLFIKEAYKHGEPIGAAAEGLTLVMATDLGRLFGQATPGSLAAEGVVTGSDTQEVAKQFIEVRSEDQRTA